jgi:hypothetical protein
MGLSRESCVGFRSSSLPLSARTSASHGVCMYRIELSPGDETVFRSVEELAVAIKRGVITPRARIWHNASSKWLPIQFHPHYKAAISMELSQAELVAGAPVKPLTSLNLEHSEAEPSPSAFAPPPAPIIQQAPPAKKKSRPASPKSSRSRRPSKPRRQLRIALVGALLLGGAQWVLSAPLFSRSEVPAALAQVQRHLFSAPTGTIKQVSSPNTAAMMPVVPSSRPTPAPVRLEEITAPAGRPSAPSFGGTGGIESASTQPIERSDSLGVKLVDSSGARVVPEARPAR